MGDRGEVRALVKETNISVYGSSKLGNQKETRGFKVRLWGRETFSEGPHGQGVEAARDKMVLVEG